MTAHELDIRIDQTKKIAAIVHTFTDWMALKEPTKIEAAIVGELCRLETLQHGSSKIEHML